MSHTIAFDSVFGPTSKIKYTTSDPAGILHTFSAVGALTGAPSDETVAELATRPGAIVKVTRPVKLTGEILPSSQTSGKGDCAAVGALWASILIGTHEPAAAPAPRTSRKRDRKPQAAPVVPAPIANRMDSPAPSVNGTH